MGNQGASDCVYETRYHEDIADHLITHVVGVSNVKSDYRVQKAEKDLHDHAAQQSKEAPDRLNEHRVLWFYTTDRLQLAFMDHLI